MKWNIVTDSSCDLKDLESLSDVHVMQYASVPFVITVEEEDFIDDEAIELGRMLDGMEKHKAITRTSCPSPAAWMEAFSQEGNVIAITISSKLSGSYNSACTAAELLRQEHPEKRIAVIDSVSAGAGLVLLVRKICGWIEDGMSFDEVVSEARATADRKRTIFALCSFHNLIKNGRMSPVAGLAAQAFHFWGIGIGTWDGEIRVKGRVRGAKKMIRAIVEDIHEFGSPIHCVYICHCQNLEMARQLREEILAQWDVLVEIHETKGLCSYYAERHGLIVSYL